MCAIALHVICFQHFNCCFFQDKDFGKVPLFVAHSNPFAKISTSLKIYKHYTIEKAYSGHDFFWALLPQAGDYVKFDYTPPIKIRGYVCILESNWKAFVTSCNIKSIDTKLGKLNFDIKISIKIATYIITMSSSVMVKKCIRVDIVVLAVLWIRKNSTWWQQKQSCDFNNKIDNKNLLGFIQLLA